MADALRLYAGPTARAHIREKGLAPQDIDVVVGASGGPKWLALAGLDRVIFSEFARRDRERPLHLLGSSIGSWRMACLAQRDPVAAIERFEHAYLGQRYSKRPPPIEVARVSRALLRELLGASGSDEILGNDTRRLHVVTARCHGLVGSESRTLEGLGLALAAAGNLISRRTLGWHAQRVIFSSGDDEGLFAGLHDQPTRSAALTRDNLTDVLMASGSIPLVFPGVHIAGAPAGVYRDGGLIDYHPDLDLRPEGLILFPHFYAHITPGWFDKSLAWRRSSAHHVDRTVLVAPSAEWVAGLPGGKIPDRKDFFTMDDVERTAAWKQVLAAGRRLGEEFAELMIRGDWAEHVRPLV